MADIRTRMREVAEASRLEARAPGPDAAWRRGRRRRNARAAGGAVLLTACLVAAGAVALGSLRPVVEDPATPPSTTAPSRSLPCPSGRLACGESQGIRWEARLTERGSFEVLGETIRDVRIGFRAAGQDIGWIRPALPTSGGNETGRVFTTPTGRWRPVFGIFSPGVGRPDPGLTARFGVRYGDAAGRPTGEADAVTIPVRALRAKLWVAFVPADAWLVGFDEFDAQGRLRSSGRAGCSTPPEIPLLKCPDDVSPPRT
jgi:hypothetical protein